MPHTRIHSSPIFETITSDFKRPSPYFEDDVDDISSATSASSITTQLTRGHRRQSSLFYKSSAHAEPMHVIPFRHRHLPPPSLGIISRQTTEPRAPTTLLRWLVCSWIYCSVLEMFDHMLLKIPSLPRPIRRVISVIASSLSLWFSVISKLASDPDENNPKPTTPGVGLRPLLLANRNKYQIVGTV